MNAFAILLGRCGLSLSEASAVLGVRLDTVKAWSSGRRPVRPSVIDDLRRLYRADVVRVGERLKREILAAVAGADPAAIAVEIALARDEEAARAFGLPAVGAHAAAIGLALAADALPPDLELRVVPAGAGAPWMRLVEAGVSAG